MSGNFKPPLWAQLNLDHPLARGLVGCWLLNETSGNKTHDYSGQGNTGTLTNMNDPPIATSGWVPGPHGGALAFDGSNDYVQCGDVNFPVGASPRTVVVWLQRNSSANFPKYEHPFKYGTSTAYQDFGMYGVVNTKDIEFRGNAYDFDTGIDLDDVLWHQISLVFDGTYLMAYKDAFLISTTNRSLLNTVLSSVTQFRIGMSGSGIESWNGLVSSVSIYNRALSAEEIAYLYAFPFCMYEAETLPLWMISGGGVSYIAQISDYYRQMRAA